MKQTFYYGGTILTMDEKRCVEAVLTSEGRILAVGTYEEVEAAAGKKAETEKISLEGRTMMPAFIDAHSHFSAYANAMLQADLEKAESFEDIRNILRAYKEEHKIPDGKWIQGKGYDHNRLKEKDIRTRGFLMQRCLPIRL